MVGPDIFLKLGHHFTSHNMSMSFSVGQRRFLALFGVSSSICSIIWNEIESLLPDGSSPVHLLWTLLFLKNYNTEETNRAIIKADEKTIRKWIWIMVDAISKLKVVIMMLIILWSLKKHFRVLQENIVTCSTYIQHYKSRAST